MDKESENEKPRLKPIVDAADNLSLGISIVVAIAMGVGIGFVLKDLTGVVWTLWIGVFIGISAAILNVFKAYKQQVKSYNELANEQRYTIQKQLNEDE